MAFNMRTSQAGLDVIKAFEGFRASSELLPNGRWIIGYGHLRRVNEGTQLSEIEAEAILREYDLPPVERFVMRCVLAPMTQNEFDALVSLEFNIGPTSFSSSDVVAALNGGQRLDAAHAFDYWRRAKIGGRVQVVDALVRRRAAEKALFLNAPGRLPIASSRLYRAMHDSEALPAPIKPREILVEHVTSPVDALEPAEQRGNQSATEAAAESVRQQMVRILGEPEPEAAHRETDGATPEEITAAISELAGLSDDVGVQKSVWPQHEDLPEPTVMDDEHEIESYEGEILEPIEDADVIDDLAEVEVSAASIEEAVKVNQAMDAEARQGTVLAALPYGILTLIGAVLGGYGLGLMFGWTGSDDTVDGPLAIFLPAFLSVLGILLFEVMAYYFVRALRSGD